MLKSPEVFQAYDLREGFHLPRVFSSRFGAFIAGFRVDNLATELDVDPATVYGWCRGDWKPKIERAFQIIEIARRSGTALTVEDIYGIGKVTLPHERERQGWNVAPHRE